MTRFPLLRSPFPLPLPSPSPYLPLPLLMSSSLPPFLFSSLFLPFQRPSDRAGKFKPRRQNKAPADLSFLTSDTGDVSTASAATEGGSSIGSAFQSAAPKISVTLSDLMAKVKADNEDEYDGTTDVTLSGAVRADINEGLDSDDEDDARNNFAALAGL